MVPHLLVPIRAPARQGLVFVSSGSLSQSHCIPAENPYLRRRWGVRLSHLLGRRAATLVENYLCLGHFSSGRLVLERTECNRVVEEEEEEEEEVNPLFLRAVHGGGDRTRTCIAFRPAVFKTAKWART